MTPLPGTNDTYSYRRLCGILLEYMRAEGGAHHPIPGDAAPLGGTQAATVCGPVLAPQALADAAAATVADVGPLVNRLAVSADGGAALALLRTLVRNVRTNPADPKYRRVRLSNPRIAAALSRSPDALALLVACGFALDAAHEHAQMSEAAAADAPALERLSASLEVGWSWPKDGAGAGAGPRG